MDYLFLTLVIVTGDPEMRVGIDTMRGPMSRQQCWEAYDIAEPKMAGRVGQMIGDVVIEHMTPVCLKIEERISEFKD